MNFYLAVIRKQRTFYHWIGAKEPNRRKVARQPSTGEENTKKNDKIGTHGRRFLNGQDSCTNFDR